MKYAGIDIGSRTIKLAVLEGGRLVWSKKAANTYDPAAVCEELLAGAEYDAIVATGYGRHMFKEHFGGTMISEISAFSKGVSLAAPGCRTILDIGGQDTKAISLDAQRSLAKFEMNDKCAAGTGRFLEIMGTALGYRPQEFARAALAAEKAVSVNSMCTVFAESEVISLTARGVSRKEIALGLHQSIVRRAAGLLRRIEIKPDIVFAGGVAYNECIRKLLEQQLGMQVLVPEDPQIIGALGAALEAERRNTTS